MNNSNQTHPKPDESLTEIVGKLKKKIVSRGDLPYVSVEKQLEMLEDLSSFPLGQFFLARQGADGFWTDYIINYPNQISKSVSIRDTRSLSPIERFILERCPLTLATRERFKIFQTEAQKCVKNDCRIASIPCGVMRDLITLDFSHVSIFSLIGVDFDPRSLDFARKLAKEHSLETNCIFLEEDAWKLTLESVDLITSSGLNVYISDKQQVQSLYQNFHKLLKNGGTLITSILTYPPEHSEKSEWALENIPKEDILMEKILFQDILGSKWRNFQNSQEAYRDFQKVGFDDIQIIFDRYRIFPTIIAKKQK